MTARLAELDATVITGADLSALVEAALIDAGQYEVAKALVVARALSGRGASAPAESLRLIRRSGEVVPWNTGQDRDGDPQGVPVAADRSLPCRPAGRQGRRARARHSGRCTCRSRPCRTSSRRSSCSADTCAWPSATSSTAPSGRCCAPSSALGRRPGAPPADPGARVRRQRDGRGTEPTSARGSRSHWSGWSCRARRRRDRARAAALVRPGVLRADLQRLIVMNAKSLVERDSDFAPVRRANPA